MGGLRERKKEQTRSDILRSAQTMFEQNGYVDTTIAQIAAAADIAEGTIYNYFGSKGEILIALLNRAFFTVRYEFTRREVMPKEVAGEVIRCVGHYLSPMKTVGKPLVRELFSIVFHSTAEGGYVLSEMIRFDDGVIKDLNAYLMELKDRGIVSDVADLGLYLELGYGIVMYLLSRYILTEKLSYRRFFEEVSAKLEWLTRAMLTGSEEWSEGASNE